MKKVTLHGVNYLILIAKLALGSINFIKLCRYIFY